MSNWTVIGIYKIKSEKEYSTDDCLFIAFLLNGFIDRFIADENHK